MYTIIYAYYYNAKKTAARQDLLPLLLMIYLNPGREADSAALKVARGSSRGRS